MINDSILSMQHALITQHSAPSTSSLPLPAVGVSIRAGTLEDVPFMDALQKVHTRQVGWMPTKQFEGKIAAGQVLVAEVLGQAGGLKPTLRERVGYCIAQDQYFKRDDVGIVYQMNVLPGRQRGLIGATLLAAQFERSAYGCRLYCCWCAQDIAANHFWEAMGFVPLAFRMGSATRGKKGTARVHIFWQKRIRAGDASTPWWYPAKTNAGSIREDRIVLPIPPGVHWSEVGEQTYAGLKLLEGVDEVKALPAERKRVERKKKVEPPARQPELVRRNGLVYSIPLPGEAQPAVDKKPPREKREKPKCDARLVRAARELRDRWLERVNGGEDFNVKTLRGEETRNLPPTRKALMSA